MEFKTAHTIDEKERTQDIDIEENVTFEDMYLSDAVLSGLANCGFVRPSPIQLAAIPLGRCGLDLVVQAKSGTGKTCVFSVVALEMISVLAKTTQVLVVAPTREIAVQIGQVINSIGSAMQDLKCSTFIGGTSLQDDRAKLKCCHIAVGTPGRLNQLVSLGNLNLGNARLLVLDEADQLLTGQFRDCILELVKALPLNKQVLALSATYPEEVTQFLDKFMRSPSHVRIGKESLALIGVYQYVRLLPDHPQSHQRHKTKFTELLSILSTISFNQCLVFSNSQLRAESICNQLKGSGWPASYLTGGQIQEERLKAFFALCSYKCRILVSTDLSARGLDSEHVNLVINLDIPTDQATYLHRVGRAGRFGSKGVAITLVCEGEEWDTMRAVTTLTNVQVKILHENYDANTFETGSDSLELVQQLSENDCALWLNRLSNRKKKFKSKTENKENITSDQKTKLPCKPSSKKDHEVVGNVCDNKMKRNEKKNSTNEKIEKGSSKDKESLESKMLKEENQSRVKKALCDYSKEFKVHSFSHDELLNEISAKWGNFSKDDTPTLTKQSYLNDYPSASVFKSLEVHINKTQQESNTLIDSKYFESKKCAFDPMDALDSIIKGEQYEFINENNTKRSEDYNGGPSVDKTDNASNHCDNDEAEMNGHNNMEALGENHSTIPATRTDTGKEINDLTSDINNLEVENEKKKVETIKKKIYSENTGYGQWEVVPKTKSSSHHNNNNNNNNNNKTHFKQEEYFQPHENTYRYNYTQEDSHPPAHNSNYSKVGSESMYDMPYRSDSVSYDNQSHYSDYYTSTDMYIKSAQKFGMMMEYVRSIGRMSAWMAQEHHKAMLQSQEHPKKGSHAKKHKRKVQK